MQNETRSCRCPKEHAEIWLSPPCDSESSDGRLWAADNPFDPCPECGAQAVRFVRADLVASDKPCDPADPCSTAFDLASERNTLDGLWAETKVRLDAALAQVARLREALADLLSAYEQPDRQICCNARDCGCRGFTVRDQAEYCARAALAETADTPAPAPTDDGWTAWEGGECPVAGGTMVEVVFRSRISSAVGLARNWDWSRGPAPVSYDIVAYRIVEARDE